MMSGLVLCFGVAIAAWFLGKAFPIIGSAIIAILFGMILTIFFHIDRREGFKKGIKFTSKKILQWAVILLGFGLDLRVIAATGIQSLPIIISTIVVSLVVAYLLHKTAKIPTNISILVGVGSSICGGSAIAATAPVIGAKEEEVAQSISIIFFFNVLAAIIFPILGQAIGMETTSGEAFGIFAGTAVNDTSSVTACAATWDSMWNLGTQTLDKAVTVKLTRTLAIIPITLLLAFWKTGRERNTQGSGDKVNMKNIFPFFILYFVAASLITTAAVTAGISIDMFNPIKELSKFFITMAMVAIGLQTDPVKLVRTGGKPLLQGLCCWMAITGTSLLMQHIMNIW